MQEERGHSFPLTPPHAQPPGHETLREVSTALNLQAIKITELTFLLDTLT